MRGGSQRGTKSTEVEHGTLQLTDENKLLSVQVPNISIQRQQVELTERFGPYNSIREGDRREGPVILGVTENSTTFQAFTAPGAV